jgi:hypothetical protein
MAREKNKRTVSEAHRELMHYTGASGLVGIINNQTLWATHAAFLNDATEIELFFEKRLAKVIEDGIRAELAASSELQVRPEFAHTPQEADETIVRYAAKMAEAIRGIARRFNQPYIVSFCTPNNFTVSRNGLLSQWRGYGKEGGYAIVFDTKGLEELLTAEAAGNFYQFLHWGDVHYHQEDDDLTNAEPEFIEAEETLRSAIGAFVKNQSQDDLEKTFGPTTMLSCSLKHWGFHEEREVRIVAIPPTPELVREGLAQGESRPVRSPRTFIRGGTPVPYLDLFSRSGDDFGCILPITRVVVGPHPQRELRKRAVQQILESRGIAAEVVVSQIPYIGA